MKDEYLRLGKGPNGGDEIMKHPWFADFDFDAILMRTAEAPFVPKFTGQLDTKYFSAEFTCKDP
jgi:hypothetical protein